MRRLPRVTGSSQLHALNTQIESRGSQRMTVPLLLVLGLVAALPTLTATAADMPVSFSDILALEPRDPDLTLRYGSAPAQTAALWLPETQTQTQTQTRGARPAPVIVLVHGGCWLSAYDAQYSYPLATQLARDGYAVWVPEYRRLGQDGGGWPGTAADIVHAVDALATLDVPGIAPSRTLLLGHSAGGHLALWLAGRDPALLQPPLRIVAAVGLAAITDLTAYAAGENSCQAATIPFMGASPAEAPARYRAASPSQRAVSLPTYLLRGGQDPIVGPEQLTAMPNAQAVTLDDAGHFDWVHPQTPAYAVLLRTLDAAVQASIRSEPMP
jgi:acetyl esterase/lipase